MKSRARISAAAVLAALLGPAGAGLAAVIEFTDRDAWFSAAEQVTTITFTKFPSGTLITNQYDELGVLFTDGLDFILCCGGDFPNDGAGLNSVTSTTLAFATPQYSIAVDFPGDVQFSLFNVGALIYTSSPFGFGGIGNFGGLISSQPFDAVFISDPFGDIAFADDLHFGVPAPGVLWLLGPAAFALPGSKRRRSSSCA